METFLFLVLQINNFRFRTPLNHEISAGFRLRKKRKRYSSAAWLDCLACRVLASKCRLPFTGESSIDPIQAPSCRPQDSASSPISLSLWMNGRSLGRSMITANIERTSPPEPFAIAKNEMSSLVVSLSKPSATLFEIESAARSSWLRKPLESGRFGSSSRSSTRLYSRAASRHTGSSSKV